MQKKSKKSIVPIFLKSILKIEGIEGYFMHYSDHQNFMIIGLSQICGGKIA